MQTITWNDFEKVDIRCGTITAAQPFPKARKPAYKLWVDFGELGVLRSSAQITDHYKPEDLAGRQVVAVVNFPPKQIADFISECLVLGVYDTDGSVVLLHPDKHMQNGTKIG
ncbi:MAG TPA: tRNA-binding protein [Phnomibacter sp.]|nr:tRNA-binding protein [Phnomibacter sp.]